MSNFTRKNHRVTLTEGQVQKIKDEFEASPMTETLLTATWREVVGQEEWDAAGPASITPSLWAIPEWQTKEILEYALEQASDPLAASNILLDWMNVGPASY